jgi:hypothetical protein
MARFDEAAAGAVASIDAARLKNVGHLYRASLPFPSAAPAAQNRSQSRLKNCATTNPERGRIG